MTSTNDGKNVNSNYKSDQKGKAYYIEVFKTLEAHLSGKSTGGERTQQICEAWREIYSLCIHSATNTHPHLLSWVQRHTALTILQDEWMLPENKQHHLQLEKAINSFIHECQNASTARQGPRPMWEVQLLKRAEWFKSTLPNPWGHPVLKALLNPNGQQPADEKVLEWLQEERGVIFVARLRQMARVKELMDLALVLVTAVMNRARACASSTCGVNQAKNPSVESPDPSETKQRFTEILSKEAGFTKDVWELLTDMEFVLLHKLDHRSKCIELAKKVPLRDGPQLVERIHKRLEKSPRDKKLWKKGNDVAILIAQVVVTRCMVVAVCSGEVRTALLGCMRTLVRLLSPARLPVDTTALAAPAASAAHIHVLAEAVSEQCNNERKPFVVELYIRAITAGMNELERLKHEKAKESETHSLQQSLCEWFSQLGGLLGDSVRLRCECMLTAFSLHPVQAMFERIRDTPFLAPPPPIQNSSSEPIVEHNTEFGSWASDSRTQSNLVKTSETLNLKKIQKQANILSTSIFTEGESLGLSAELCQDLTVLLSGPRIKTLSLDMEREILLENCRTYMERTHGGTRELTTELKYLNMDSLSFKHLPPEDDDENDIYYGIEKGYEHLLEFPIEDFSFDCDESDSAFSVSTTKSYNTFKGHISKSDDDEKDPLRLDGNIKNNKNLTCLNKDTNNGSKVEKDTLGRENEKDGSLIINKVKQKEKVHNYKESKYDDKQSGHNLQRKNKKKERKWQKRKEKIEAEFQIDSSSPKILNLPDIGIQKPDSVGDGQGNMLLTTTNSKESFIPEHNDCVLFDGLFSMDEIKSDKCVPQKIDGSDDSQITHTRVSDIFNLNSEHDKQNKSLTLSVQSGNLNSPISGKYIDANTLTPNVAPNLNREIKEGIKKLVGFRRQKNLTEPKIILKKSNAVVLNSIQCNMTKKSEFVNVSEAPQESKKQSIESVTKNIPMLDTTSVLKSDFKQTQYQEFLKNRQLIPPKGILIGNWMEGKNVQQTLNKKNLNLSHPMKQKKTHITGDHSLHRNSAVSSRFIINNPTIPKNNMGDQLNVFNNKVTKSGPKSGLEIIKQQSAATVEIKHNLKHHKKNVENAPNTFSRLSYMHRNKQANIKSKSREPVRKTSIPVITTATKDIDDKAYEKISTLQSKGEIVISRKHRSPNLDMNNTMPHIIVKKVIPSEITCTDSAKGSVNIISNVPNKMNETNFKEFSNSSKPLKTKWSANSISISKADFLKHQSLLKPTNKLTNEHLRTNTQNKHPTTSSLSSHCEKNDKPKTFILQNDYNTKDTTEGSHEYNNIGQSKSDWKNVMNAIRALKTPIRDETQEISLENYANEFKISNYTNVGHLNKSNSNNTCKTEKKVAKCNLDNDSKKTNEVKIHKSSVVNLVVKQNETDIIKQKMITKCTLSPSDDPALSPIDDPPISAVPAFHNFDYDQLDELIDDDLRKEIGELSSDEDSYRSVEAHSSTSKYVQSDIMLNNEIITTRLKCLNEITGPILESYATHDISTIQEETTSKAVVMNESIADNVLTSNPDIVSNKLSPSDSFFKPKISLFKNKSLIVEEIPTFPSTTTDINQSNNERISKLKMDIPHTGNNERRTHNVNNNPVPKVQHNNIVLKVSNIKPLQNVVLFNTTHTACPNYNNISSVQQRSLSPHTKAHAQLNMNVKKSVPNIVLKRNSFMEFKLSNTNRKITEKGTVKSTENFKPIFVDTVSNSTINCLKGDSKIINKVDEYSKNSNNPISYVRCNDYDQSICPDNIATQSNTLQSTEHVQINCNNILVNDDGDYTNPDYKNKIFIKNSTTKVDNYDGIKLPHTCQQTNIESSNSAKNLSQLESSTDKKHIHLNNGDTKENKKYDRSLFQELNTRSELEDKEKMDKTGIEEQTLKKNIGLKKDNKTNEENLQNMEIQNLKNPNNLVSQEADQQLSSKIENIKDLINFGTENMTIKHNDLISCQTSDKYLNREVKDTNDVVRKNIQYNKKRMAILNRKINHFSNIAPIALGYTSIHNKLDKFELESNSGKQLEIVNVQNSTFLQKKYTRSMYTIPNEEKHHTPLYIENTNRDNSVVNILQKNKIKLPINRTKLRSSNILQAPGDKELRTTATRSNLKFKFVKKFKNLRNNATFKNIWNERGDSVSIRKNDSQAYQSCNAETAFSSTAENTSTHSKSKNDLQKLPNTKRKLRQSTKKISKNLNKKRKHSHQTCNIVEKRKLIEKTTFVPSNNKDNIMLDTIDSVVKTTHQDNSDRNTKNSIIKIPIPNIELQAPNKLSVSNNNDKCLENKIMIRELSSSSDKSQKILRVQLPNGNVFRVTISGHLRVDLRTVLSQPNIQPFLINATSKMKPIIGNIKHFSRLPIKLNKSCVKESKDKPTSVASYICDMDTSKKDNISFNFNTEFGVYFVKSVDSKTCFEHQNKFNQNCVVRLENCNVLKTIALTYQSSNANNDNINGLHNDMFRNINIKTRIQKKDNSENKMISYPNKSENVTLTAEISSDIFPTKKDKHIQESLDSRHEIKFNISKCPLRLSNNDVLNKYEQINKVCKVKVVRCDSLLLVEQLKKHTESTNANEGFLKDCIVKNDSIGDCHTSRKRSNSESILSSYENPLQRKDCSSIIKKNINVEIYLSSLRRSVCNSDWFFTKQMLQNFERKIQKNSSISISKIDNDSKYEDMSTDCDSDVDCITPEVEDNVFQKSKSSNSIVVPSLLNIATNFLSNNYDILNFLQPSSEVNKRSRKHTLKRKLKLPFYKSKTFKALKPNENPLIDIGCNKQYSIKEDVLIENNTDLMPNTLDKDDCYKTMVQKLSVIKLVSNDNKDKLEKINLGNISNTNSEDQLASGNKNEEYLNTSNDTRLIKSTTSTTNNNECNVLTITNTFNSEVTTLGYLKKTKNEMKHIEEFKNDNSLNNNINDGSFIVDPLISNTYDLKSYTDDNQILDKNTKYSLNCSIKDNRIIKDLGNMSMIVSSNTPQVLGNTIGNPPSSFLVKNEDRSNSPNVYQTAKYQVNNIELKNDSLLDVIENNSNINDCEILATTTENLKSNKEHLKDSVTLVYDRNLDIILKGTVYEDPVVGTFYVFPMPKKKISPNGSFGEIGDDKKINMVNLRRKINDSEEITALSVKKPKITYSRRKYFTETSIDARTENNKINLKRKLPILTIGNTKKYKKSKNIDTKAIYKSAYCQQYKKLLEYCSSVKFSFSIPFHKEHIDVLSILQEWPIEGSFQDITEKLDVNTKNIFFDSEIEVKPTYDPNQETFAEEIAIEQNDEDFTENADYNQSNMLNFDMGFGERSDRAIQDVRSVNYNSKMSAATLSDVKLFQPFLSTKNNFQCEKSKTSLNSNCEQVAFLKRCFTFIELRHKVRSYFKQSAIELNHNRLNEKEVRHCSKKEVYDKSLLNFPYDLMNSEFYEPIPQEMIVQVVQVGQLPVSAAAQNPITCDPRVTQVSNASPSQGLIDHSSNDEPLSETQSEYTELTTADLSSSLAEVYEQNNQNVMQPQITLNSHVDSEVSSDINSSIDKIKDDRKNNDDRRKDDLEKSNNVKYSYKSNNSQSTLESDTQNAIFDSLLKEDNTESCSPKLKSLEKTDQIAHAMNAAGIATNSDTNTNDTETDSYVNILSSKMNQSGVNTAQSKINKTSINAIALQQALAQILPPPLSRSNSSENHITSNSSVGPQVLHIVQGKNAPGNQITIVDNQASSVVNNASNPSVLHIVQNKSTVSSTTPNITTPQQGSSFSGLSLLDAGLQQGGNQLLHIVNTGSQKNCSSAQLLKRVNLLTNLTNVHGTNEQKMVQFVCKSADGKPIQLNSPHQRSMVLRLQPFESTNIINTSKTSDSRDLNTSQNITNTNASKECTHTHVQHEIKSRSVYEENYAKFIQNSSSKPLCEKSTTLPKFNQAFGKPVFQDNQKAGDVTSNHLSNNSEENLDNQCPNESTVNLDHMRQINSPPLLLRKSPGQTTQSQVQSNLVQQLKQTITPMNIQTMHGGVIYTRQIPVNIGGGQTINLITVPSTDHTDENGQKQQNDLKFINKSEVESSIIKLVPQNATGSSTEVSDASNTLGASNDAPQSNHANQPVLTQMRIKLPMLSKAPQIVSGTRLVRPSFFQIQRNVIGGGSQPVYQQLVLTAAPSLGQQIRLPQTQTSRQVKVHSDNQSSSQMSSSTLEQLREFDMVLEQVKERSTVQPNSNTNNSFSKKNSSTDSTDGTPISDTTTESTQQVLYSIGSNHSLNVTYINRKPSTSIQTTSNLGRSPDSTAVADSPSSSTSVSTPRNSGSETPVNETSPQQNQPKPKSSSKSKSRPKSTSSQPSTMKINTVPPKPSTQKPLEDEQTTQRILYILAEYKEQVEKSPDKDKPAPRRRTNAPSNPGSSKRKKSGSRKSGGRDMSPIHGEDTCRTMGSEDSSCGTSQGDCSENCLENHSPQDSPRKVVRKLSFDNESATTPRPQPPCNVIVADGQTITVARGTAAKPATAVLMPANYILPVSMVKGGQQIAIVTNRGPKILTVAGEGGTTNALLLQRLISPTAFKPVLARPGVRHVRLPTAALHNLQAFNLATFNPPDSSASPAPTPTPPDLIETRANSSPWPDREPQDVKPERGSSPEGSEPWNMSSTADPHDYSYEETVRTENLDRTVLGAVPGRYSPDMEGQRIFDKMFDVDTKRSYILDSQDGSPRCGYDIDTSDCDDKPYQQVVHRRDHRHHRLVSAAALRHKYAVLEHELRFQKSLSEECEDLGVDSPSAAELFPEAELLFSSSPANDNSRHAHTPQPGITQSQIPQPDIDDQIATDQLLCRDNIHDDQEDLGVSLGLDEGIVTVSEDGMRATITLDQEEFARSHPNTTFHREPTEDDDVPPYTISGFKGRHITSTIFHAGRGPATVLMTAPQTTVISQAISGHQHPNIKYIDNIVNSGVHNNISLPSVLVKEDGLSRQYESIMNDSRELHLSNTASTIVHSNAAQVIRRVCYDDDRRDARFLLDEPDALIAGDDAKMVAEDCSRDANLGSMVDVDYDRCSPERHTELYWESNSERSYSRRPLDFSSDSDKCCRSPMYEETYSTDSSSVGTHMRLDSVIKDARGLDRGGSGNSSADDTLPPLRTYPPKRLYHMDGERSVSGKTRAGERFPEAHEVRRRASGRGVVKRGCHCCNGSPAPPRPKKSRPKKPNIDFSN